MASNSDQAASSSRKSGKARPTAGNFQRKTDNPHEEDGHITEIEISSSSESDDDVDDLAKAINNLQLRRTGKDYTLYEIKNPKAGAPSVTDKWPVAHSASLDGSPVKSLLKREKERHGRAMAYVAFRASEPGVYGKWEDCKQRTSGQSGSVYEGYMTLAAAEAAYAFAVEKHLTAVTGQSIRARPIRATTYHPPSKHRISSGSPIQAGSTRISWYSVYVGVKPGVYASYAEAAPNVIGIEGACYESWESKEDAVDAYMERVGAGKIGTVILRV
ncbi:hypothetical protein CYLTODRAFT_459408 [Cylindrobasidium torrendii FP15055 ss-10]|uniref:Ribonuclease H1 N-terminal domain-containing protein n=1 Tax=Cylindrobasidium torrendii FP15055 ss-10 TaxID=1314674 RepID=A0A0D7AUA7_9AGAR|nr:hypothetical protein CYLTODRAFT_459408 [Cylindrobasidium torrendii FP15055 ss-10]